MRCADLVGVIIVTLDPLEDSQTVGADRTNMMDILQSVDAQRNQTATTVKLKYKCYQQNHQNDQHSVLVDDGGGDVVVTVGTLEIGWLVPQLLNVSGMNGAYHDRLLTLLDRLS